MSSPPHPIAILFEDAEALIVDKPAGLALTPPRRGGPSLADRLSELRLGFRRDPAVVHRLDTDTSGCLLLARNPKALARLGEAFAARRVEKRYLGIVRGVPDRGEGTIALALAKVSSAAAGWRMVAAHDGKPAVTHWRLLATRGAFGLIEFRPETGRTHQLRVHAASGLGLPLLGDPVYGAGDAPRTMLHAAELRVARANKRDAAATAPVPADFVALGFGDG